MDKNKRGVMKAFLLISQLGINMMVPIAMCVAIGILIDRKFDTHWVIPLLFLGIGAGARNTYRMAMAVAKDGEEEEDKQDISSLLGEDRKDKPDGE